MILVFNIIVLLIHLILFVFSRWATVYVKMELKQKGCTTKGNKLVPCLVWDNGQTTYCKPKDLEKYEVGKTYIIEVSKKVFFDYDLKI